MEVRIDNYSLTIEKNKDYFRYYLPGKSDWTLKLWREIKSLEDFQVSEFSKDTGFVIQYFQNSELTDLFPLFENLKKISIELHGERISIECEAGIEYRWYTTFSGQQNYINIHLKYEFFNRAHGLINNIEREDLLDLIAGLRTNNKKLKYLIKNFELVGKITNS